MKRNVAGVYSYAFSPNTNTINLSGIPSFNISNLFAILDLTIGEPIYAAGLQGMGYTSLSGTTLILSAQMGEAEANDSLMIIYDDGYEASAAGTVGLVFPIASVNTQVSASHPLPVSVSVQTAGLAQDFFSSKRCHFAWGGWFSAKLPRIIVWRLWLPALARQSSYRRDGQDRDAGSGSADGNLHAPRKYDRLFFRSDCR